MIDIMANYDNAETNISMNGDYETIVFETCMILSAISTSIEEHSDKKTANEFRKGCARYLVDSVINGDILKQEEQVAIDGEAMSLLQALIDAKNSGRFD